MELMRLDFEDVMSRPGNYWQQTKHLTGKPKMAAFIAVRVAWDGIVDDEPETIKCGTYLPWLELAESRTAES